MEYQNPIDITVVQKPAPKKTKENRIDRIWENKITVALTLIDKEGWSLVEDYNRRGIRIGRGWVPRDVYGSLVFSDQEIRIYFDPTNPLWEILHFPRLPMWPEWEKTEKTGSRQEEWWSTTSEKAMAEVTRFLTKD